MFVVILKKPCFVNFPDYDPSAILPLVHFLEQIDVNAPAEKVFAVITTPEEVMKWHQHVVKFEYEGGKPARGVGINIMIRSHNSSGHKTRERKGTISRYQAPREFGIQLNEQFYDNETIYRVEPSASGCRVTVEINTHFKKAFAERMAKFFMGLFGKFAYKQQLKALKATAETGDSPYKGRAIKISPKAIAIFIFFDLMLICGIFYWVFAQDMSF